jgi:hypothetical protein
MKEYKVGQILFLIGESTTKIIPVQIVEEVVRTTLSGKEKTYTIMLPDKDRTNVDIQSIKGEIFDSKDILRKSMLENATKAIDGMIDLASHIKVQAFGEDPRPDKPREKKKASGRPRKKVQENKKDDIIEVQLGNGQVGKLNVKDFEKASEK